MKQQKARSILLPAWFLLVMISIPGFSSAQSAVRQGQPVPVSFCIDPAAFELYQAINAYRNQYNLPPVPLSKSLSYVASLHARDLYLNHPDRGSCNAHSWSGKGHWTPFCYPRDETKKNSVWDKPRELTRYPAKAYEIVYWENNPLVKDTVMMVWQTEDYFNSFLLNAGKWQGKQWASVGVALYENYACAWFGEARDPEGEVPVCGNVSTKPAADPPALAPAAPATPADTGAASYYVIVKTNLTPEAAEKFTNTLKINGYPDSRVLNFDQKIRISVFQSPDKPTATVKLREVKKVYKDAWLLKR